MFQYRRANFQLTYRPLLDRVIGKNFINDLPPNDDLYGENGYFHTFGFDGPIFKNPIKFVLGEKICKEYKTPSQDNTTESASTIGFWFCDLLPIDECI